MKLMVIGFGQCGSRIADEFSKLNSRAQSLRGIEIVTGAFAVNTDAVDLTGLTFIQSDYQHRILIGSRKTGGHGVGKINMLGAKVAMDDADKVIDAIRTAPNFFDSDAFLLIAGASGGTGSGALPIMTKIIKERYQDKPFYDLIVLPFEHEETTEELAVYNTATCIKSASTVADAVILVDNQRYVRKDFSLQDNISRINQLVAEPFFNLLCAGEERKVKHIGAKLLDAGDIIQTLCGFTAIGYGRAQVDVFNLPLLMKPDFHAMSIKTYKGIQAMDEAMSELSIACNPAESDRALYLLSAPIAEMNMDLVKELGHYLRTICPNTTIRNGDYPREKSIMDVTVVISGISNLDKIKGYYKRTGLIIPGFHRQQDEIKQKLKEIDDAGQDLPSLL